MDTSGAPPIAVYQFGGDWGIDSLSPFCLKLTTALRWLGVPFEARPGNPQRAPHGKLPYIDWKGQRIGDSALILRHVARETGRDLDAHLDDVARGRTAAATRVVEDSLYWLLVLDRWVDDGGWAHFRRSIEAQLPRPLRGVLPPVMRRKVREAARAQGTGRMPAELLDARAADDALALASLLGERPFLGGDTPCTADASAYGVLANALEGPIEGRVRRALQRHPALLAWYDRLRTHR